MYTSPGRILWLFPTEYPDFVMGPFVSRNLYAAFVELILPIGLAEAIGGRRRFLHAAMCGAMFASVVAGASRAGFVVVSGEVVAALLLARHQGLLSKRTLLLALGEAAILLAAFIGLYGGTALWQRLQQHDPYAGRRELLRSTVDMALARPWTGFGLGTWRSVYPQFAWYDDGTVAGHAHNDWAEWAAEGGLPLFAMMLWVAAFCFRPAVQSLWGLGTIAVLVHGLVDSPMTNPVFAGWFFVLAGALAAGREPPAGA
jgi:O-antigen ligase